MFLDSILGVLFEAKKQKQLNFLSFFKQVKNGLQCHGVSIT